MDCAHLGHELWVTDIERHEGRVRRARGTRISISWTSTYPGQAHSLRFITAAVALRRNASSPKSGAALPRRKYSNTATSHQAGSARGGPRSFSLGAAAPIGGAVVIVAFFGRRVGVSRRQVGVSRRRVRVSRRRVAVLLAVIVDPRLPTRTRLLLGLGSGRLLRWLHWAGWRLSWLYRWLHDLGWFRCLRWGCW